MSGKHDYIVTYRFRGEQTSIVRNCSTAQEAYEKFHRDEDVDSVGYEVLDSYIKSAQFVIDRPGGGKSRKR